MGVTYRVDVNQLEELERQVKHVNLDLTKSANPKLWYSVDAQSIGSAEAAHELTDYLTRWKSGRDRVITLLDSLSQLLLLAATTYREAEQALSAPGSAPSSPATTSTTQPVQNLTY